MKFEHKLGLITFIVSLHAIQATSDVLVLSIMFTIFSIFGAFVFSMEWG